MNQSSDISCVPQLSLLAEVGFGGVLLYVDPCDTPPGRHTGHQAPRVTLNPGGNPTDGECKCAISLPSDYLTLPLHIIEVLRFIFSHRRY